MKRRSMLKGLGLLACGLAIPFALSAAAKEEAVTLTITGMT